MHLRNLIFLSSQAKNIIQARAGHQGASALTGTITINQNIIFAVYEVEFQKPVKAKF